MDEETRRGGSLPNTLTFREFMRKDWTGETKAYERMKADLGFVPCRCWIADAVPLHSPQGRPGLRLTLLPIDGPYYGDEITETIYATPRGLIRLRALFEAAGGRADSDRVDLRAIAKAIAGETLFVPGQEEPWEPGYPHYDAWEEEGWRESWRRRVASLTVEEVAHLRLSYSRSGARGGSSATEPADCVIDFTREQVPRFARRLSRAANRAISRRPVCDRSRPRSYRRSHRTASATRGSPSSDDDGDPAPGRSQNSRQRGAVSP